MSLQEPFCSLKRMYLKVNSKKNGLPTVLKKGHSTTTTTAAEVAAVLWNMVYEGDSCSKVKQRGSENMTRGSKRPCVGS